MGILLGIDLGTEGARVGAFTEDGDSLGSVHRPYRTTFPRPGWAEQDPEAWWTSFVDAARTLLATDACRSAGAVVAVAPSTTPPGPVRPSRAVGTSSGTDGVPIRARRRPR